MIPSEVPNTSKHDDDPIMMWLNRTQESSLVAARENTLGQGAQAKLMAEWLQTLKMVRLSELDKDYYEFVLAGVSALHGELDWDADWDAETND